MAKTGGAQQNRIILGEVHIEYIALKRFGTQYHLRLLPAPNGDNEVRIASLRREEVAGRIVGAGSEAIFSCIQEFCVDIVRGIRVDEDRWLGSIFTNSKEMTKLGTFIFLQEYKPEVTSVYL